MRTVVERWRRGREPPPRLRGDTGKIVYAGGGPHDVIGAVGHYHTPILACGRIVAAADNEVKAFVRSAK